jgi:hypothetical protein
MDGYIGITDYAWFHFNKGKGHKQVVFWRKAAKPVQLGQGIPFFFLVKAPPQTLGHWRMVEGFGSIEKLGSRPISELWDRFGQKMGAEDLECLTSRLCKDDSDVIGYYLLDGVVYLDRGISLRKLGIEFSDRIVSGKRIDTRETRALLTSAATLRKPSGDR